MVSLKDVAIERNRSSLDEPLGSDSQPQGPQNSRRHLLETSEAKGCDQSPGQHQDLNRLAATSSVRSAERIDMVTVEKGKAQGGHSQGDHYGPKLATAFFNQRGTA